MSQIADFDHIAPFYDMLAKLVFGSQLDAAQRCFLNDLGHPTSILILGGGTGSILEPLVTQYPDAHILYLEASAGMIAIASKRFEAHQYDIDFVHGNEHYLERNSLAFDAIITPFVLDTFENTQLPMVINILFEVLTKAGRWVHTDFYLGHQSPWWQRSLVWGMYKLFRISTGLRNQSLPDFDSHFDKQGFKELGVRHFYHKLVKTVLYEKLGNGPKPLEEVS